MFLRLRSLIQLSRVSRPFCQSAIRFNDEVTPKDISGSVATKFQVFRNETGIIFDIEEERRRQDEQEEDEIEPFPSAFAGINLERKTIHLMLLVLHLKTCNFFRRCQWSL